MPVPHDLLADLHITEDKFQALIHKEWEANGKVVREANIQAQ